MNALITALLAFASLACQSATVAQDVPDNIVVRSNKHDATHSQLSVVDDGNAMILVVGEEDATAIVNGKAVPQDRLVRDGDKLTVLDEDGEELFAVRILDDGAGLAYPYDADMTYTFAGANDVFATARDAWRVAGERRKLIGVTTTSVDGVLAWQLGLEPDSAFVINSVNDGKPADLAGMQVNDIVVSVEGTSPANTKLLREKIAEREAGDTLNLSILRRGEPMDLQLTLQEAEGAVFKVDAGVPVSWRSGDTVWPEVSYVDTFVSDAVARQRQELGNVEHRLADVRAKLEARMADMRNAQAAGASAEALEARALAVEELQRAMEQLQDVSSVLRAQALTSAADRARQVGIARSGQGGSRSIYVPQPGVTGGVTVGTSGRPAPTPSSDAMSERLQRMEDRMARLEEMLQRLIESGNGR